MEVIIEPAILTAAGAVLRTYEKGEVIFYEGDDSRYYYQMVSGSVCVQNIKEDGSEFIQGLFHSGQAFGMAAVLVSEPFPAMAVPLEESVILRLRRESFLELLQQHPKVLFHITQWLCRKLYQKAFLGKGIASQAPENRIHTLIDLLKKESGCNPETPYLLDLSRQQVADMIGLRVETVIRAVKKMEEKGTVVIKNGKVYY